LEQIAKATGRVPNDRFDHPPIPERCSAGIYLIEGDKRQGQHQQQRSSFAI
jgi:hypothetical protein